ncbi:AraC family transcriptional regulator [Absiella sp. AM29-15]|uniref:AraC family transcriptional regulator n=1 Tax=Absiella sp. AM29-15 TaxID=2292278 RepID=UPI000E40A9BC|nr:effector binding domain-containing protein [Absiella sp. AM29-15]RGC44124.1 AraC family transcriptional regulator [Absiella sp. AM29-15]
MEWNEKLQIIIDYVENHLQRTEEPVNEDEIAKIAGCSFGFFQKVFSYMNGISFAEYVRYRKMTLAGYDLKSTKIKVVEISYKYGYDSPTSFTKAFQNFHGISPKDARKENAKLNVYPKMQINTAPTYAWCLEKQKAFRLIGKTIKISKINQAHYQSVPAFWNKCQKDGTFSKLVALDEGISKGMFGLFSSYEEDTSEIEYSIMVISNKELPTGFTEITIPLTTWAKFDCIGPVPQAIQSGWKFLNEEWLMKYPFRHAACPELEWFSDGNAFSKEYLSQIWIPIIEEEETNGTCSIL